eukprot:symbB.v1.2.024161.t2/scaffold2264.1/size174359/16
MSFLACAVIRRVAKVNGDFKDVGHFVEIMACPGGCLNGGGQIPEPKKEDQPENKSQAARRQRLQNLEELLVGSSSGTSYVPPAEHPLVLPIYRYIAAQVSAKQTSLEGLMGSDEIRSKITKGWRMAAIGDELWKFSVLMKIYTLWDADNLQAITATWLVCEAREAVQTRIFPLRLESLAEDFLQLQMLLCRSFGYCRPLPPFPKAVPEGWRPYMPEKPPPLDKLWTTAMREQIFTMFRSDFAELGYSKHVLTGKPDQEVNTIQEVYVFGIIACMALHYNGRYNPSSDLEILVWQPASLDTDVLSTGRETEKVLPTTWVERRTCEIECESLPFESEHSCDFKGSNMAEELAVC